MKKGVEIISFDMDGTLIPKEFADHFWLEKLPELYSKKHGLSKEKASDILMEHYDEIGKNDVRWYQPEYWFSRYDLNEDPEEVLQEVRDHYDLYDDAKEAMKKLHKEYKLIVISNGIKMFIETGLGDHKKYFSSLYSSVSDFQMSNKKPSLYLKICRQLHVEPGKVVHIGDSLHNDYEPAVQAGLTSYLLDRNGKRSEISSGTEGVTDLLQIIDLF